MNWLDPLELRTYLYTVETSQHEHSIWLKKITGANSIHLPFKRVKLAVSIEFSPIHRTAIVTGLSMLYIYIYL